MEKQIEARIFLSEEQIAQVLRAVRIVDRHEAMVTKYGEACTKTQAAKIMNCSVPKVRAMLEDGRLLPACAGERVDVRSMADYIESKSEADRTAKIRRRGQKSYA